MPWLIRVLAIEGSNEEEIEERRARRALVEDAIRHLNRRRVQDRFDPAIVGYIISAYERHLYSLSIEEDL